MKKIISISIIVIFITSCKKDWNCKCTFTATGEVANISIKDTRKKVAKHTCETSFTASDATCSIQ